MKIRMLKTVPGSLDGIRVATYEAEKEYDLTGTPGARDLAQAFVAARMAVEAPADAPRPQVAAQPDMIELVAEPEVKAVEVAPENKMLDTGKRPYNRKAK